MISYAERKTVQKITDVYDKRCGTCHKKNSDSYCQICLQNSDDYLVRAAAMAGPVRPSTRKLTDN
jgi:hypothetical protein